MASFQMFREKKYYSAAQICRQILNQSHWKTIDIFNLSLLCCVLENYELEENLLSFLETNSSHEQRPLQPHSKLKPICFDSRWFCKSTSFPAERLANDQSLSEHKLLEMQAFLQLRQGINSLNMNRYEKAKTHFTSLVTFANPAKNHFHSPFEFSPKLKAKSLEGLSISLFHCGKFEHALCVSSKLIQLDPFNLTGFYVKSQSLFFTGKVELSLSTLEEYIVLLYSEKMKLQKNSPQEVKILQLLISAYNNKGKIIQSQNLELSHSCFLTAYLFMKETTQSHPQVLINLSMSYLMFGNVHCALETLAEIQSLQHQFDTETQNYAEKITSVIQSFLRTNPQSSPHTRSNLPISHPSLDSN
eukprot:Sdes_comp15636_c0_seq1m4638